MSDFHSHDAGLARDLELLTLMQRRRAVMRWMAGVGALSLIGCGGGVEDEGDGQASAQDSTATVSGASDGSTVASCSVIPEETAGPYPGDGSNTANGAVANALVLSGIVRSDIRSSLGSSTTAPGVPLTVKLRLVSTLSSCADLSGHAVYLWHCDRDGRYSMYSSGITAETYLRGVQETGADGTVSFSTIFPGCYDGRMPHIHFEVYRNANTATSYSNKLRTSQLAFPVARCTEVYSSASGYSSALSNFARVSFATDMVFSDGSSQQIAAVTGSVSAGYTAELVVGIAV